ncbi:ferric reductase-like transmembrane domain-containing protein, partial [Euzebya pacifica]|uniref:ferric reductase-like transmembrane domain-containing protein n=1 Tax=Euzebya pacifica TaxID=1608957 RepID=UPI0030F6ED5D
MAKKTIRISVARHAAVAVLGLMMIAAFWASRPQWDPEMRLWKSVGDGALILLLATLAIGPLAKLWRPAGRAIPWRREAGIWFAVLAAVHAILILNGWARWSLSRLFGFEFVAQLGREARMEPGFGLANLLGIVALMWGLALAATSTDAAVRRL